MHWLFGKSMFFRIVTDQNYLSMLWNYPYAFSAFSILQNSSATSTPQALALTNSPLETRYRMRNNDCKKEHTTISG